MRINVLLTGAALATAAAVLFAPAAEASSYTFDITGGNNFGYLAGSPTGPLTVDLTITATGSYTELGQPAELITGVSGTITNGSGYNQSVDTGYTGLWCPTAGCGNQYQVTAGLFTNAAAPGIFTDHGVYPSGGADFIIDNAWFPGTDSIDDSGGIGLLLNNGATVLIFANNDPPNAPGGYYIGVTGPDLNDYLGVTTTPLPAALPLFASGLGALGLFGWRRKRKNAAAIAAAGSKH
jgi:hypothetical protein